jgi:hypothetical protein
VVGWQRPGITCECCVVEREGVIEAEELPSYERLQNIPARSSNRPPAASTSFDCLPNFWGTSLRHPRLGPDLTLLENAYINPSEA